LLQSQAYPIVAKVFANALCDQQELQRCKLAEVRCEIMPPSSQLRADARQGDKHRAGLQLDVVDADVVRLVVERPRSVKEVLIDLHD
jgi:hypothetical protein